MKKELLPKYNPKDVEDRLYNHWLDKNYFNVEPNKNKQPYTIVIPPPNITSKLHLGHAFETTLIDILIRFKRMQGYNALFLPGCDHASIATEVKILEDMAKAGLTKAGLGREGFMKRAWDWYENYGGTIINQLKKLGASCDWQRSRFTMDEGLSMAVTEVFVRLYKKGLIYRGERLINWCPYCKTSISDAEVEHEEKQGYLWYFSYPVVNSQEHLQFATTRPETMLGDVALAVNPEDARFSHFIGKKVLMPIVSREIPIIADNYVKMDFGTGVVKITPAHDFNDFEIGLRHNLQRINILNDDGTINANGGIYEGLSRQECREQIIENMTKLGLFIKKEDITHAVGTHDRCKNIVEPMLKLQWFVKMEDLAKPAIKAYKEKELNIVPERFGKVYLNWLENIRDWCISRQLWWGHRIPAYYCKECGEVIVSKSCPASCSCGSTHFVQDEDSLDTWFSSALWPFSTLGWPEKTDELAYFYPTNVLSCGYDILFFWVVRMVFSGIEHTDVLPFKDVFLHGILRDEQGRKMSKSLGNGVDPIEVVEQYGADALRFAIITGNSPGNDLRYYSNKVEASRNFLNKIWNASRFILMNTTQAPKEVDEGSLTSADKWIISRVNTLALEMTQNIDKYELGIAAAKVYDFVWDEFCDWYIEMVKPRIYNEDDITKAGAIWTLNYALMKVLKLLHPFIPFITEEIFTNIANEETILYSPWPKYSKKWDFTKEEEEVGIIKEAVRAIRNIRANMNVVPSRKVKLTVVSENAKIRDIFENSKNLIMFLAYASEIVVQQNKHNIAENDISVIIPNAEFYMPFADLVDFEKEKARLLKDKDRILKELELCTDKLNNVGFVSKAPAALLKKEEDKQLKFKDMLNSLNKQITAFLG